MFGMHGVAINPEIGIQIRSNLQNTIILGLSFRYQDINTMHDNAAIKGYIYSGALKIGLTF
ncbi:MAG: hypothetical protein U9R19_16790 [Bacteroidota bacterium]|nr:hypothetical protein [Bacteroidota bacterium]